MLTWKRRKVTAQFLNTTQETTEHYAEMPNGAEWALRKADDLFFLYKDGEQSEQRHFFNTLKSGKAQVQVVADHFAKVGA